MKHSVPVAAILYSFLPVLWTIRSFDSTLSITGDREAWTLQFTLPVALLAATAVYFILKGRSAA